MSTAIQAQPDPPKTLADFLNLYVPPQNQDEDPIKYQKRLVREVNKFEHRGTEATRVATAVRLQQGIMFWKSTEDLSPKDTARWKKDAAKELKLTPKMVRNYINIGAAIAAGGGEAAFPETLLDQPIRRMERAVKTWTKTKSFATPPKPKPDPAVTWQRKVTSILDDADGYRILEAALMTRGLTISPTTPTPTPRTPKSKKTPAKEGDPRKG